MAGPVYNAVWLFLCTLHPAYSSFKAVKNKNVKEYVRWMMYWIVFALFSAIESILDPLLTFWLPFYCEVKVVFLLYLASPITRGSGVIYRRWVHPLLCSKEEEIDLVLEKVQEQGYNTGKTWIQKGVQWLGGMLITTAIRGGGGLVQQLRRSYSIMDMRDRDWGQDRFTDVTDQMDQGHFSPLSTPSMRRREILPSKTYPDRERIRGEKIFQPGHVLSTESISSGYNTDQFAPVDTDTMDTQDYELWERRRPVTDYHSHEDNPSHEDSPGIGRNRKIMRSRAQVKKSSFSDDEEETFYESFQTPFGKPLPKLSQEFQIQSPDSSCYPSDRESIISDFTDDDDDDSNDDTVYSDILDNLVVVDNPKTVIEPFKAIHDDRDKTPTREKEEALSLQELQIAAKKLNLCLVSPAEKGVNIGQSLEDEKGPIAPKRKQTMDQGRESAGSSLDIPNNNKDEDDGRVLYQSPGYPSLSTNSWQPIKEKSPPFSTTRMITQSPNTGLTRIRKYQSDEDDIQGATTPPPVTTTDNLVTPISSKCPHCTIHTWLPHSPGCKNK